MRLRVIQLMVIVLAMALAVSLAAQAPAGGQAPAAGAQAPRGGGPGGGAALRALRSRSKIAQAWAASSAKNTVLRSRRPSRRPAPITRDIAVRIRRLAPSTAKSSVTGDA